MSVPQNPWPLGPCKVAVPGTPVDLLTASGNQAFLGGPGQPPNRCYQILFETLAGNTGKVYLGKPNMNKATLAGVVKVFPAPAGGVIDFSITVPGGVNEMVPDDWHIDADNANEGLLVTLFTF